MVKFDAKNFVIALLLAFVLVTIINVIVHQIYPSIEIIKTGFALILIMAAIAIVMVFVFAADKKVDKMEVFMFFALLGTMVGIYFVVKNFIPELFALLPESLKEVFSAVVP